MKNVISGFKFGMMLQFAIGPITLLIFQISVASGFLMGLMGMIGAGLADASLVAAAILGIGALLKANRWLQVYMKVFGGLVMIGFGALMVLSSLGINFMPTMNLVDGSHFDSVMLKIFVLTIASPMTILFWTGVFASKVADEELHTQDLWLFGFGAVMTTVVFQTLVAAIGSGFKVFLGPELLMTLNILVGCVLILFGIKLFMKDQPKEESQRLSQTVDKGRFPSSVKKHATSP